MGRAARDRSTAAWARTATGSASRGVAMRLQKGLAALAATPRLAEPVAVLAQAAVERSRAALPIEADIRRLEAVALAR